MGTFYRIVAADPPTLADFFSYELLGHRPPSDPALYRYWQGLSVFDSAAAARALARKQPDLGSFIAELRIPDDAPVEVERWGYRPGHYTLWAEPHVAIAFVVRVVPR